MVVLCMWTSKNKTVNWIFIGVSFLYVPDLSRPVRSSYGEMCIGWSGFSAFLTMSGVPARCSPS